MIYNNIIYIQCLQHGVGGLRYAGASVKCPSKKVRNMKTIGKTTKTVTAKVYNTQSEMVRVAVPAELCDATARAEVSTGYKLCGWHRGRKWGIVRIYSVWDRGDGLNCGDLYTAYRLDCQDDREAFDWLADSYTHCYEY